MPVEMRGVQGGCRKVSALNIFCKEDHVKALLEPRCGREKHQRDMQLAVSCLAESQALRGGELRFRFRKRLGPTGAVW